MVQKAKKIKNIDNKSDYFIEVGKEPDYKDVLVLKRFLTDRQKIMHHTYSGVSEKSQRKLANEIKKARYMALLPYTDRQIQ